MPVLGRGTAYGSCSLLHALGTGYGASLSLDIPAKVMLRDTPDRQEIDDPHGLLDSVLSTWKEAGLPIGEEEYHWMVRSEIPMGVGLKSSSAIASAAVMALADATDTSLEIPQIVELAVRAQIAAQCTITGSVDDTWAAVTTGWKVVNPQVPIDQGVALEGHWPEPEEWAVFVVERGERTATIDPQSFARAQINFQKALGAIQQGALDNAMTENGRGVALSTADQAGRKISNDLLVWGARCAGISGSGPSIVFMIPSVNESAIDRILDVLSSRGLSVFETAIRTE
jgi:shikimate kinase